MEKETIIEIINCLILNVIESKIEAHLNVEPDRFEVDIQPWKPLKMNCPYREDDDA